MPRLLPRLLLPVPAEVLTRSIRWSVDWQRAGRVTQDRVILSRQLVGGVTLAETRVEGVPQSRVTLALRILPSA